MIDSKLIKELRLKVNSDSHFTLEYYKNRGGRNHWSLICSCMDWIDIAIDYIVEQPLNIEHIKTKCMQAYAYISAIDIVWQSIQQLHKAIIDPKSTPFMGEKKVFADNRVCNDDNEYFKHIRAVFGAHPVNLRKGGGKWYASWPTDFVYNQYDYSVILYSADVDQENIVFGYRFAELDKFLYSRYNYLNTIIKELDRQCKKPKDINRSIRLDNESKSHQ